jgi:prepilin-type processing-associated H-X9-DG protein
MTTSASIEPVPRVCGTRLDRAAIAAVALGALSMVGLFLRGDCDALAWKLCLDWRLFDSAGLWLGLAGVSGTVVGIASLLRIGYSTVLTGRCWAATGTFLSMIGVSATILLPSISCHPGDPVLEQARNNLRQLYLVTHTYAEAHNGALPPAESWPEALAGTLERGEAALGAMLRWPSFFGDSGRAYAMNAGLGGTIQHPDPNRTVLFFECRPGAPPAGGPDLLPDKPRHAGRYVIGFLDGHVESVEKNDLGRLIWDPQAEPPKEKADM